MNRKSPLFDAVDPEREIDADRRAEEDVRAGRFVSHGAVRRWLASWSSRKPLPRPKVGE